MATQASSLTGKHKLKIELNEISFDYFAALCRDLAYPNLKAGEQNVPRNYYEEATTEKPDGDKCLSNYQRFGSDYRENVSATVKPLDYTVPCKDANHMSRSLQNSFKFESQVVTLCSFVFSSLRSHSLAPTFRLHEKSAVRAGNRQTHRFPTRWSIDPERFQLALDHHQ